MYELILLFFDICLFRKGPQDVPVSKWLLQFLVSITIAVSFLLSQLTADTGKALLQATVEVTLIVAFSWAILLIAKRPARFLQTACALLATDAIISFFAIPAMATLAGQVAGLAFLVIILLMVWHWLVSAYIFGKALQQSFSFGLGVAFLYILSSYQVMALLFPELIVAE